MTVRKQADERPFLKAGISMSMVRAASERIRDHQPPVTKPRTNHRQGPTPIGNGLYEAFK